MNEIDINEYLVNFDKATKRGTCKECAKAVSWNREKLASHKRANCTEASDEQKELFRKRSRTSDGNNSVFEVTFDDSMDGTDTGNFVITEDKKNEIDEKIGKLFFRTGMSLRILDSPAFRDLIIALNPAYAKVMPKARTLGGVMLNKEYEKSKRKVTEILKNNSDMTLITDGWTNICGHHIVNFMIKAPSQPSIFYKSMDTTGTTQDAVGIAAANIAVLEELGAGKFTALVTDNANVMKASNDLVEQKFPHISAFGCAAHCLNLLIKDILVPHEARK